MVKVSLVFSVLVVWAVVVVNCASSNNAPAPAPDCSTLIFNLVDCLSFVSNGSKESKPQGSCCSGLKTVLKADAECLCEAFKNSAQLGVELNVSKALSLPVACGVSAPPFSKCGLSTSPGAAPVDPPSPKSAPSPKSPAPVSPSTPAFTRETTSEAPAPVPGTSDASLVLTSFAAVLVSLVIASCSYF